MVKKQSIINLSRCRSKGYASVFFGDSKVIFLREGDDADFRPSL